MQTWVHWEISMYENTCKAKMRYTDKWKSKQYEKYNSKCMFFLRTKKLKVKKWVIVNTRVEYCFAGMWQLRCYLKCELRKKRVFFTNHSLKCGCYSHVYESFQTNFSICKCSPRTAACVFAGAPGMHSQLSSGPLL